MKRSSPPQWVSRLRTVRALPLLAAGAAALLMAMWAGLYRSGWEALSVARVQP